MPKDLRTLSLDEWASMTLAQWDALVLDPVAMAAFLVAATQVFPAGIVAGAVWRAGAVTSSIFPAGAVAQEIRS